MDWLKQHYDRVLLTIFGLVALVLAGLIVMSTASFNEVFEGRNSKKPKDNKIPALGTENVKAKTVLARNGFQWAVYEGSLFVAKPYLLKDGQLVPLKGDVQLHPPVENEWLVKYQLPYWEPGVLNADADSDGFTNFEEWRGKTDPLDSNSKPGYVTKLRLNKFIQSPFRLKFSGTPDDGQTFTINTYDLKTPTQFLKRGEMVAGTAYKIINYETKADKSGPMEKNVSELTVENQDTGDKVVLVYDKVINSPTSIAELKNLSDGSLIKVKKLEEFTFKPEQSVKYKLLDVSDAGALIQRADSGEKFQVSPEQ